MNRRQRRGPLARLIALPLAASLIPGCLYTGTVNRPIAHATPSYGYRPSNSDAFRARGGITLYLAFSGGGTRAAALAYGVLAALRDTAVVIDGKRVRLIDEVDTVSGVSGGSFPATYYGLFGDRIFEEFEPRFLRRNIQGTLVSKILMPWNLIALMTPWLSRSDIAKTIYDKTVFDQATFDTLLQARGPRVYVNATDLSSGERFVFNQGYFDVICSDLGSLPVASAVAASSAVPGLLSPVSLRNYAGACGFELPEVMRDGLATRRTDPRRYRAVAGFAGLGDSNKRYLHLIDGGISDNLGLRAALDTVSAAGGLVELAKLMSADIPPQLVIISVNAETDPPSKLDLSAAAPSFAAVMNAVSGSQIRRYNFETLVLVREAMELWAYEARRAGVDTAAHMVEVSFDNVEDEKERRALKSIPTSFKLSDGDVDQLIAAGRELLMASPDFQELLRALR
ncbi:MAG: patatin-like phospholipase family protein [Myxococcales bacterium]|nr:MAG: patatin-like phospholipase family protein [Myxococcales bacterium]